MEIYICQVSIAPIRSTASDKSEMVTQLLFGETVVLIEEKGTWCKVQCTWDNYIGWTDHKMLKLISHAELKRYKLNPTYCLELAQGIMAEDHFLPVVMGASLPEYDGMKLKLGDLNFTFSGQVVSPVEDAPVNLNLLLKVARKYLNAPYLWGGRSPFGIDCSGFTQIIFKMMGVKLLRDASQQVTQGESVDFVEESQLGDLAFFENKRGRIAHVGLLIGNRQIIHAHGKVRLDRIDHYGIYNDATKKYTHRLRVIKRVLDNPILPDMPIPNNVEEVVDENQMGLF